MTAPRPGQLGPVVVTRADALAALVPWAISLVAVVVADRSVEHRSLQLSSLPLAAAFYLGFVAVPSVVPVVVARRLVTKALALTAMTVVAAVAGTLVVTTDDAQAGFAIFWVGYASIVVAAAVWFAQRVVAGIVAQRHADPPVVELSGLPDQLAAFAIDVGLVLAVVLLPPTLLGYDPRDLATLALTAAAGAAYLGVAVTWPGATVGQAVLGLRVVDAATFDAVPPGRSIARGILRAGELAILLATPWLVAVVLVDGLVTLSTGRSLPDRLVGTTVLARRPRTAGRCARKCP